MRAELAWSCTGYNPGASAWEGSNGIVWWPRSGEFTTATKGHFSLTDMARLPDPQMTRAGAGRRTQHAGSLGPDQHKIDSDAIIFCDLHEVTTLKMGVNGRAAIPVRVS